MANIHRIGEKKKKNGHDSDSDDEDRNKFYVVSIQMIKRKKGKELAS